MSRTRLLIADDHSVGTYLATHLATTYYANEPRACFWAYAFLRDTRKLCPQNECRTLRFPGLGG